MKRHRRNGFTLVEILIVVVILGILSAIVVPQFANSTEEASAAATLDQLKKIRNAVAVYQARNNWDLPVVQPGVGTWGELLTAGEYMKRPPMNRWVTTDRDIGRTIVYGTGPDAGYQMTHGWIYDPLTGDLWAGGFDADDQPHSR
jgi:general secretion pathway protein G